MYFRYQCLNGIGFENDDVERVVSCIVLCYTFEYIFMTNSEETHKSCVCIQYAKHDQTLPDQVKCLVVFCTLKANR